MTGGAPRVILEAPGEAAMESVIKGLHHVTATVDDAQRDLDFCLGALGLRLVKQTVNFDNKTVYHFYYGDERGTPGTIWTTFPYRGKGVPVGRKGAGQIGVTSFSVPAGSLGFWKERLGRLGVPVREEASRFGEDSLAFADPSGLVIELVGTDRDRRVPWTGGGVGEEAAIRGIHGVTMVVARPAKTLELMTGLLGFDQVNETEGRLRLAVNGDEPGRTIDIVSAADAPAAMNGLGTVHHVAMAVSSDDDQLRLRGELIRLGVPVTEVLDRKYFRSIYFREPGGVLFEAATVQPGFTVDEALPCLGQELQLPAEDEPRREEIAAGLPGVSYT
jgi:glyoxalase family protein